MDISVQQNLVQHFEARFLAGDRYRTIVQARKVANDFLGRTVDPFSTEIKQIDEAIEKAVVRASRTLLKGSNNIKAPQTTHEAFDRLVSLLEQQPRLSVRTSTSVREQAYSTPIPLAYLAANLAQIDEQTTVYEPTAGNGSLLMTANPKRVIANEINSERIAELEQYRYQQLTQFDASEYSPEPGSVDVVITNPPFGRIRDPTTGHGQRFLIGNTWTSQIDQAIALKSLEAMKDDGRGVLLIGGILTRSERNLDEYRSEQYNTRENRGFFYTLYRRYNVIDHFSVDGSLYAKQGAGFPIDIIVIEGRRKALDAPLYRNLPAAAVPKVFTSFNELKEKLPNVQLQPISKNLGTASRETGSADGEDASKLPSTGLSDVSDTDASTANLDDRGVDDHLRPQSRGDRKRADPIHRSDGPDTVHASPAGEPRRRNGNGDVARGMGRGNRSGQRFREGTADLGRAAHKSPRTERPSVQQPAGTPQRNSAQHMAERSHYLGDHTNSSPYVSNSQTTGDLAMPEDTQALQANQDMSESQQRPYKPLSKGPSLDTLIPRNMANAAQMALSRFEKQYGDIDEYVTNKLGFESVDVLHQRLYAEQIDSIGLAIHNLGHGNGFVIGDQTGIGKGCQCAALMIYAIRQGKPVVFFTKGNDLYKDMFRDLKTIGRSNFSPFITDANAKIPLEDGSVLRTSNGKKQEEEMRRLMALGSLDNYPAVFTTYSQLQTIGGGKEPFRRAFLRWVADQGAILVCDESHLAGGSVAKSEWDSARKAPDRAEFMRELIDRALAHGGGVGYSSATYAKDPRVMDLYARSTDLRYAVSGRKGSLESTLQSGGVPLQQVIAAKFVKSLQMLRRERSYEGISFQTVTVPADREVADQFSAAMRAINEFDRVKRVKVRKLRQELKKEAKRAGIPDNAIGEMGVRSSNFTSLMHNCIGQGLLAQKAEAAVQKSLEALQAGKKPVIALDNTMGSFIGQWVEMNEAESGDAVDITFSDLLERYLVRSLDVTIKDYAGRPSRRPMTDDELGPEGVAAYEAALEVIREGDLSSIPISPIDYIRGRLEQAGYSTTEVTGRTDTLNYAADMSATYHKRPPKETTSAGKINAVNDFNSGRADVIIINRSGCTGISLHASKNFENQQPRIMIVAQASLNINDLVQTFGRIHRTGQVELPEFKFLTTDLPAENRPAAVISRKMATFNANVTADRETAISLQGVVDFYNEYGAGVIGQILEEIPELDRKLDYPMSGADADDDLNLIAKVTGRLPLLPVAEQEKIYELIESGYRDLVAQKEAMGESLLQADQLDLDARTIARMEIVPPNAEHQNEFTGPVNLEVVDVKSLVKPFTQLEVANQGLVGLELPPVDSINEQGWVTLAKQGRAHSEQLVSELAEKIDQYRRGKSVPLEAIERKELEGLPEGATAPIRERIDKLAEKLNEQLNFVSKNLRQLPIGQSFRIIRMNKDGGDAFYGVVTGIDHRDRGSSPAAPSAWHLRLALSNGEVKSMTLPMSAINVPLQKGSRRRESLRIEPVERDMWSGKRIYELFDDRHEVRQNRQMLTGNIVKACDRFPEGKITNFTDYKGRIRQGLLLPKKFDLQEKLQNEPVVFKEPYQIKAYFSELTEGRGRLKTLDEILVLRIDKDDQSLILETPRSKQAGGKYYLDEDLINRIGKDFVSSGDFMRAKVPPENIESTLLYILSDEQIACFDPTFLDKAREYMGVKIPEMQEAPDGEVLDIEEELFESNVAPYVEEPTADDREKLESLFKLEGAESTEQSDHDVESDKGDSTVDTVDEPETEQSDRELSAEEEVTEVEPEEPITPEEQTEAEAETGEVETGEVEEEELADWEIEELLESGDLDGVMNALVGKIDISNLREPEIAPLADEDLAPEDLQQAPEPSEPEPSEQESVDDSASTPQPQVESDDSNNAEYTPETSTPQASEVISAVKSPEEHRAFAEKSVSQFLHEAGLAEAVVEEGFHLRIENVPHDDLTVKSKQEGTRLLLTLTSMSDSSLSREMTFEISQDGSLTLDETATVGANSGVEHRVRNGGDRSSANLFSRQIISQNFAYAASEQLAEQELQALPHDSPMSTVDALQAAEEALDRLKNLGESIDEEMADASLETSQYAVLHTLRETGEIELHTLIGSGDLLPGAFSQNISQSDAGDLSFISIYNQFERHADNALKVHFNPLVAEVRVAAASGKPITGEDFSQFRSLKHKLEKMPKVLREYYSSTMLTKIQEMGAVTIVDAETQEPIQDPNVDLLSGAAVIQPLLHSKGVREQLAAARREEQLNLPESIEPKLAELIIELGARESVFEISTPDFLESLLDEAGIEKEGEAQSPVEEGITDESSISEEPVAVTAVSQENTSKETEVQPSNEAEQPSLQQVEEIATNSADAENIEEAKAILETARQAFAYQAENGQLVRDSDVVSAYGHRYNLSYHEATDTLVVSGAGENSLSIVGTEKDATFTVYSVSELKSTDVTNFEATAQYLEEKSFQADQTLGEAITGSVITSTSELSDCEGAFRNRPGSEFIKEILQKIVLDIPDSGLSSKRKQLQGWLESESIPIAQSHSEHQNKLAREIAVNVKSFIPYALRENKATTDGKMISGRGKSYSFEVSTSPGEHLYVLNLRTRGEIRLVDGVLRSKGMQGEDLQNWQILGRLDQQSMAKQAEV
ncbi:MAG: strawberry notch C-terminal domain-containing protein [Cyanobacteria bacterium P01_D01_bin.1]